MSRADSTNANVPEIVLSNFFLQRATQRKDHIEINMGHPALRVSHVPIYQHGYGRMDSSFSYDGLCTSRLGSCLAIVIHCPETTRTALSHAQTNTGMIISKEFSPIFEWVVDGKMGANVYVVVLRGAHYAADFSCPSGKPHDSERLQGYHEAYMKDFLYF